MTRTEIRITDFHAAGSTGGWLCLPRDVDQVVLMMGEAAKRVERMWGGGRPTLEIRPELKGTQWPRWVFHAWLVGPPADPKDDGTHLVVTWFGDEIPEDPLRSAVARVDANGGWEALAEGFAW